MALGEFELIQRYFTDLGPATAVVLGVGDDGAVLSVPSGQQLVAVIDTSVAGTHFPADADPFAIGWRALAVNLSDLAAMAATPRWFTLALTLPAVDEAWLAGFAAGLRALAEVAGVALVGGDTTRGPLSITIQAEGWVPVGQALRRSGARPGDGIYVTGSLGDAAAGLALYQGRLARQGCDDEALLARYLRPQPRLAAGQALRGRASAGIDISDGLLQDLGHLLQASGVGACLDLTAIPLSAALRSAAGDEALSLALGGGDDYEICFTLPSGESVPANLGIPVSRIGCVRAEPGLLGATEDGVLRPLRASGYRHF